MATIDLEYEKKLAEMRQYLPFLDTMIQRLDDNEGPSRENQRNKLKSLRSWLMNGNKRLKLANLLRCEEVLMRLFAKVKKQPDHKRISHDEKEITQSPTDKNKSVNLENDCQKSVEQPSTSGQQTSKADNETTYPVKVYSEFKKVPLSSEKDLNKRVTIISPDEASLHSDIPRKQTRVPNKNNTVPKRDTQKFQENSIPNEPMNFYKETNPKDVCIEKVLPKRGDSDDSQERVNKFCASDPFNNFDLNAPSSSTPSKSEGLQTRKEFTRVLRSPESNVSHSRAIFETPKKKSYEMRPEALYYRRSPKSSRKSPSYSPKLKFKKDHKSHIRSPKNKSNQEEHLRSPRQKEYRESSKKSKSDSKKPHDSRKHSNIFSRLGSKVEGKTQSFEKIMKLINSSKNPLEDLQKIRDKLYRDLYLEVQCDMIESPEEKFETKDLPTCADKEDGEILDGEEDADLIYKNMFLEPDENSGDNSKQSTPPQESKWSPNKARKVVKEIIKINMLTSQPNLNATRPNSSIVSEQKSKDIAGLLDSILTSVHKKLGFENQDSLCSTPETNMHSPLSCDNLISINSKTCESQEINISNTEKQIEHPNTPIKQSNSIIKNDLTKKISNECNLKSDIIKGLNQPNNKCVHNENQDENKVSTSSTGLNENLSHTILETNELNKKVVSIANENGQKNPLFTIEADKTKKELTETVSDAIVTSNKDKQPVETSHKKSEGVLNSANHIMKLASSTLIKQDKSQTKPLNTAIDTKNKQDKSERKPLNTAIDTKNIEEDILSALNKDTQGVVLDDKKIQDLILGEKRDTTIDYKQRDVKNANIEKSDQRTRRISFQKYKETAGIASRGLTLKELKRFNLKPSSEEKKSLSNFQIPGLCENEGLESQEYIGTNSVYPNLNETNNEFNLNTSKEFAYSTANTNGSENQSVDFCPLPQHSLNRPFVTSTPIGLNMLNIPLMSPPAAMSPLETIQMCLVQAIKKYSENATNANNIGSVNPQNFQPQIPPLQNIFSSNQQMQPTNVFNQVQSNDPFQRSSNDIHNNDESFQQSHYPQFIEDRNNQHSQHSYNFNANYNVTANYRGQSPNPMLNYNKQSRLSDPRRNSVSRESLSRESVSRDSVRGNSVIRENVRRDSVMRENVRRDSVMRDIVGIDNPENYESSHSLSMNFNDPTVQDTGRRQSLDSFSPFSPVQTDSYLFSPVYNQTSTGYINDFNKRPDSNIRHCNNYTDDLNANSNYSNTRKFDNLEFSRKAASNLRRFNDLSSRVEPLSYHESSMGRTFMGEPLTGRRFDRAKSVGRISNSNLDRHGIGENLNKYTFNRMSRAPSVGRLSTVDRSVNHNWINHSNSGTSKYSNHHDRSDDFDINEHIQVRNVSNIRPTFKRAQSVGRFSVRSHFNDRFPPEVDSRLKYGHNNTTVKNNKNYQKFNETIFDKLDCKDYQERCSVSIARNYNNTQRTSYDRDLHNNQRNLQDTKRESLSRDPRLQAHSGGGHPFSEGSENRRDTKIHCASERSRSRDRKSISEKSCRRESGHSIERTSVSERTQPKKRDKSSSMMNYSKSELIKNVERNTKSSIRNFKIPKLNRTFNDSNEKVNKSNEKLLSDQSWKSLESNKGNQKNESTSNKKEVIKNKIVKKDNDSKSSKHSGSENIDKMKMIDSKKSHKKSSAVFDHSDKQNVKISSNQTSKLRSSNDNVNRTDKKVLKSLKSDEKLINNALKNDVPYTTENIELSKKSCVKKDASKELINKEDAIQSKVVKTVDKTCKDVKKSVKSEILNIPEVKRTNRPIKDESSQLNKDIKIEGNQFKNNQTDNQNQEIQKGNNKLLNDATELFCIKPSPNSKNSSDVINEVDKLNHLSDGFWMDMDINDNASKKITERKLSPFELSNDPETASSEDLNQIDMLNAGSDVSDLVQQNINIHSEKRSSNIFEVSHIVSNQGTQTIIDVKPNNCTSQNSSEQCLNIGDTSNLKENINTQSKIILPNDSFVDVFVQMDDQNDNNTFEIPIKIIDTELIVSKETCFPAKNNANETLDITKTQKVMPSTTKEIESCNDIQKQNEVSNLPEEKNANETLDIIKSPNVMPSTTIESESCNDIPKPNEVSNLLSILNDKSKILEMLSLLEQSDESEKLRKKLQKLADIESDDEQNVVGSSSDNKVNNYVNSDHSTALPTQEIDTTSQLYNLSQEIDNTSLLNDISQESDNASTATLQLNNLFENVTTSDTTIGIIEQQNESQNLDEGTKLSQKRKILRKKTANKTNNKKEQIKRKLPKSTQIKTRSFSKTILRKELPVKKPKVSRELLALQEDIRDMFISKGVLNLNPSGIRMCRVAKDTRLQEFMSNVEVTENKTELNEISNERRTRKRFDNTISMDSSECETQKELIKITKQSSNKPDCAVSLITKKTQKKKIQKKKQFSENQMEEKDTESQKEFYGKFPCVMLQKDDVVTNSFLSAEEISEVRNSNCYDFESDDSNVAKSNLSQRKFRKRNVKEVQIPKWKKKSHVMQLPVITLFKKNNIIQKNDDDIDDDLLAKVKPGPKSKKKMLLAKSKICSNNLSTPLESQPLNHGNDNKDPIQTATPESSSEDESLLSFASVNSLEQGNRQKGKKKKKSQWSSGIIKRKKKILKCIEMLDSEFFEESTNMPSNNNSGETLSNEFFTDKSYYFDIDKTSYDCKICTYNGLEIVNHHKLNHPHCEFTMARLETTTAEEAIGQSLEIISTDCNTNDNDTVKTSFQCRFCKRTFNKFSVQRFYEHILRSHTGEYIEPCNICHKSNNIDNNHCKFASNMIKASPPNDSNSMLIGYICTICNYTQLHEGNAVKHIDLRHNQTSKALQINLCMLPLTNALSTNNDVSDISEDITREASMTDNIITHVSKLSEIITSFNNARSVSVTDCIQSKIDATAAVTDDSSLGNSQVDKVNEDWLDEDGEIQRPRSCAFALNTEPNQNSNIVSVKQEPLVIDTLISTSVLNTERKLAKGYPVHVSDMRVRIRDDDVIEYTCYIQDCARTFQSLLDLTQHLNNLHLTHTWNGICTECRKNVKESDGQYATMDILEHVISVHMENNESLLLELKNSKGPIPSAPKKPMIQLRPIADLMSRIEPENIEMNSSANVETNSCMIVEVNPSINVGLNLNPSIHGDVNPKTNIKGNSGIDNVQTTDDDLSSVRIENVVSLSNMDQNPSSISAIENTQIVVIRKQNVSSAKSAVEIAQSVEVAQSATPEGVSDASAAFLNKSAARSNSKQMKLFEKLICNHKLRHLFKCGSDNCAYSTNLDEKFLEHLRNHASLTHEDVGYPSCIYCFFSDNNPQNLITHMITVHGHCCYLCKYCVFRAAHPIQIKLHQDTEHKDVEINILSIAPHPLSKTPEPIIYTVESYVCKQGDCDKSFVTRNTFLEHLAKKHSTCSKFACHICHEMCLRPIYLLNHYRSHLFCLYQCIYCKYGTETDNAMTHHMMEMHPWRLPQACVRYIISPKENKNNKNPGVPIIELDKEDVSMYVTTLGDCGDHNETIEEDPLHTVIDQSLRLIPFSTDTSSLVVFQNEKHTVNRILEVRPLTSTKSSADNISVVSQVIYANEKGKAQMTGSNETSSQSNISTPSEVSSPSADVKVNSIVSSKKASVKKVLPKKASPKKASPKIASPKKAIALKEPMPFLKIAPKPKEALIKSIPQFLLVNNPTSSIKGSLAIDIPIEADVESLLSEVEQATATLSEINRLESNKADETKEGNGESVKRLEESEKSLNENVIILDSDDENTPAVNFEEKKPKKKRVKPSGDPIAIISLSDDDSENPAANTTPTDLLVPTENSIPFDLKESTSDSPKKKLELQGYDLYRCGNKSCGVRCLTMTSFRDHVTNCGSSDQVTCFHCNKTFRKNVGLLMHLATHGKERWKCGLCDYKKDRKARIANHLKQIHKSVNYVVVPLDKLKTNESEDIFILKPISCPPTENASTKNLKEIKQYKISPKPTDTVKKTYSPDEISLLPLTPVWENELCCSRCSFKTKVRSNMVRHLMLHAVEISVPSAAPVNPVPHLETNEKHFDKMSNLALSSNMDRSSDVISNKDKNEVRSNASDRDKYPKYIPTKARYVCGATGCSYISVDESMLKYHWEALHSTESNYKCAHCPPNQQMNHERALTASRIVSHLKMHDSRLYNCIHCNYYHFQKHLVERHLLDKHPNLTRKVGVVREMEESSEASVSEESVRSVPTMDLKPWQCGLCPYKTMLKEDIMQHSDKIHNIKSQFKCSLCTFVTSIKQAIENHVDSHHQDQTREITVVYYKDDPQLKLQSQDNHPLWWKQRKRPSQFNEENIPLAPTEDLLVPVVSKKVKITNDRIPQSSFSKIKELKPSITAKLNKMFEAEKSTKDCTDQIKIVNVKSEAVEMETVAIEYPEIISSHSLAASNDQAALDKVDGQRQYRCTLCTSSFAELTTFREHLYEEFDYPRWLCSSCNKHFFSETQVQEHAIKKHNNVTFKITKLQSKRDKESLVDSVISAELDGLMGSPLLAEVENTEPESILPDVPETDTPDLVRLFGSYGEPNGLKYKCPIINCNYQTIYRLSMENHLIEEVKCERWRCTSCSEKFIDDTSAKSHSQQAHKPSIAQIETLIGNAFKTNHNWQWIQNVLDSQHLMMPKADDVPTMSTMKGGNMESVNATKRSAPDDIVKPTPKKIRSKNGLYGCDVCPYTTILKPTYTKHMIKHQDRLYSCKYCRSFTGSQPSDIETHCRIKHENKPVCYITTDQDTIKINNSNVFCFLCQVIIKRSNVANHIEQFHHETSVHITNKNNIVFVCIECGSVLSDFVMVVRHFGDKHRNSNLQIKINKMEAVGVMFRCDLCPQFSFKYRFDLDLHRDQQHTTYYNSIDVLKVQNAGADYCSAAGKSASLILSTDWREEINYYLLWGDSSHQSSYNIVDVTVNFADRR